MEHDYVENIRKTNDYRIVWVDKDYDIFFNVNKTCFAFRKASCVSSSRL